MEQHEAIKILAMVKGNWYRQPSDDPTIAVWADTLAGVSYQAAQSAVRSYVAAAGKDPPTAGEIRKLAVEVEARMRESHKKLPWPEPTPEERAEGSRILRDAIARIGKPMPAVCLQREPGEEG